MYEIPFSKMIQPRLGATWAYNGKDTVYASYAQVQPGGQLAAARRVVGPQPRDDHQRATSTQNGVLFATDPVASSSGKLFVDDLTPRTHRRVPDRHRRSSSTPQLVGRALRPLPQRQPLLGRHEQQRARRRSTRRPGIPRELYIPDLTAQLGADRQRLARYVIAELDGAFTKYYEVTLETEWRSDKAFVRGSYTWSHYYGNFDQDNSTIGNDANIFIGSSNIADGAGRQLWDFKRRRPARRPPAPAQGLRLPTRCRGTRRVGVFVVAQSGQPWETWSYEPYRALTTSHERHRSATPSRPARAARPRTAQVDLNYTQNITLRGALQRRRSTATCSTCSTSRPATTSSRARTTRAFGTAADLLRPAARRRCAARFQF